MGDEFLSCKKKLKNMLSILCLLSIYQRALIDYKSAIIIFVCSLVLAKKNRGINMKTTGLQDYMRLEMHKKLPLMFGIDFHFMFFN